MADIGDRGRRRRRRGMGRKERGMDKADLPPPGPPPKTPIILAKPPSDKDRSTQSPPPILLSKPSMDRPSDDRDRPAPPKTLIMLKQRPDRDRDESTRVSTSTSPSIPSILANEGLNQPTYQIQRNPAVTPSTPNTSEGGMQNRLAAPQEMMCGSKLIDEAFMWCDNPMEMLLDQTDFLTVGVLGLQGAGKSTVLSMIAGNNPGDPHKSFVLRPQSREMREVGLHQTMGVDMFVTTERIMLLDTQPLMSASVLDHMIHHDKKLSSEYSSAENCLHMQSLMIATFLMTVCNVVIVVLDWFADYDLLRLVQTAEMLKPATPGPGHDNSSGDESPEHFPHIVFVLNKARRDDFSAQNYEAMRDILSSVFAQSRLKVKGGVSLLGVGAMPGVTAPNPRSDINLYLLPNMHSASSASTGQDAMSSLLAGFRGHPSFEHLVRLLRNSLYAVPRGHLTHTTLSEKNWFHYAARTWEAIKKSPLLTEYNRLLP